MSTIEDFTVALTWVLDYFQESIHFLMFPPMVYFFCVGFVFICVYTAWQMMILETLAEFMGFGEDDIEDEIEEIDDMELTDYQRAKSEMDDISELLEEEFAQQIYKNYGEYDEGEMGIEALGYDDMIGDEDLLTNEMGLEVGGSEEDEDL